MRPPTLCATLFAILAIVLPAIDQNPPRSYLVYVHVIHMDVARQDGVDSCLIVDDGGQFQFEESPTTPEASMTGTRTGAGRGTARGAGRDNPTFNYFSQARPKVYRGRLAQDKFDQLKSLVEAPELVGAEPGKPPSNMVVAHQYEKVELRIHRMGETQELAFLTVDGRGPMPSAVRAFVPWMDGLHKSIGHPDHNAEPRDCTSLDATPDFNPQLQKR